MVLNGTVLFDMKSVDTEFIQFLFHKDDQHD